MPAPQPNPPAANQSPTRYNAAEDLLARNLPIRAHKVALHDETGSFTFAELAERVNRCANALLGLGIQPQARIALCLLDSVDFPTCFLGAIKAGIVPIPLNTIKPKAFIVLKAGVPQRPGLDEELKVFLKGRLAPYKCPRVIEFRDELPKTATGKIRRTVLREEANAPRQQPLDAGGV